TVVSGPTIAFCTAFAMSRISTRSNGVICPSCREPVARIPMTIARYTSAERATISPSGECRPQTSRSSTSAPAAVADQHALLGPTPAPDLALVRESAVIDPRARVPEAQRAVQRHGAGVVVLRAQVDAR